MFFGCFRLICSSNRAGVFRARPPGFLFSCNKPPSDEGGGKTKVLTEGEKEEKLKRCSKTSLPQPRWRSAAPSSEGAEKAKALV